MLARDVDESPRARVRPSTFQFVCVRRLISGCVFAHNSSPMLIVTKIYSLERYASSNRPARTSITIPLVDLPAAAFRHVLHRLHQSVFANLHRPWQLANIIVTWIRLCRDVEFHKSRVLQVGEAETSLIVIAGRRFGRYKIFGRR